MIVSLKIDGQTKWQILFDQAQGAKVTMPEFRGNVHFNVNKSPGFGAPSQSITPMQNAVVSLPWKFGQSYPTLAAATASIRAMQALGGLTIHIMVTQDSEKHYYPHGAIESYDWEQDGAYVMHTITFTQKLATTIEP